MADPQALLGLDHVCAWVLLARGPLKASEIADVLGPLGYVIPKTEINRLLYRNQHGWFIQDSTYRWSVHASQAEAFIEELRRTLGVVDVPTPTEPWKSKLGDEDVFRRTLDEIRERLHRCAMPGCDYVGPHRTCPTHPMIQFSSGQFVKAADHNFGVGKVARASSDEVEIEYFDSISPAGRHRVTARRTDVEPALLSPQRRCYWEEGGVWRVGRVVWRGDGEYGVRPPDSTYDVKLQESEMYVRWDRPIDDPIDVLVAHGNESPHFHLCRQPFIATITEQRAASHGMHGVVSSVIDLHDHQIEVVRRVLEDPKQRYLLADEVGLGKTIEAGLIIRQYLLDHPSGHVVVITPPLLRRQWVSELRQKFLTDDFGDAVVSVLAHDDTESWHSGVRDAKGRYRPHSEAGLVVVDEVHNLAALAGADGDRGGRFTALAELTSVVPRLLLLSATPLLNNELTFLAMLHLLDPDIYQLSDLEGFRLRVRSRQALGTAFFTFQHDIPPFLLLEKVAVLRAMFPDDGQLGALLDAVYNAATSDPTALTHAVTAARIHISETYRIHRRLLRTRRTDALLATFPVRGRQRPADLPQVDRDESSQEWLDDWREYVRSTLGESRAMRAGVRRAFVAIAERSGSIASLAAAAARYRMEPTLGHSNAAELTSDEEEALRSWEVDAVELEILRRGSRLEVDPGIALTLVEHLKLAPRKTVVFTSFTAAASFVRTSLIAAFGADAVAAHLEGEDPAVVEEELDRFREGVGNCWILVCDRSAEEGRNLQFAQQAIHFDLPLWPNRLEQRIGRLDRYGRGALIPTYMVGSGAKTIDSAWARCLIEGFQIFDSSIASLQFAVDALLPEIHDALLDDGPIGLERVTQFLPSRLTSEREAVVEQDALDAIEQGDATGEMTSALDDVEDMWFHIQRATEGLLCDDMGNLRFHRVIDQDDAHYRSYIMTEPGRTPNLNSMPLIPWDILLSKFRPVIEGTGTYSRRAAMERPDVRLFRVGEPLIDALAEYMRWDDRGQTFAFWRPWRNAVDDGLYFRFDYVIDPDIEPAANALRAKGQSLDRRALQRRADAFLPPRIVTLWSDMNGVDVKDAPLIEVLKRPFDPTRGDRNLNRERRWALDELFGDSDWDARCRAARSRSEEVLRRQPALVTACETAVARFESLAGAAIMQRQLRLTFLSARERAAEEVELADAVAVDAALLRGIEKPSVRLDAVGAIVVSRFLPQGPAFPKRGHD